MVEQLRQPPHDGEPQPQAAQPVALRIADLMELLEDAVEMFGRDADSGVLHLDGQPLAIDPAADADRAGLGIAQGVVDQIAQQLHQQAAVGAQNGVAALHPPDQPLGGGLLGIGGVERIGDLAGGEGIHHRGNHPGLQPGNLQQTVQQPLHGVQTLVEPGQQVAPVVVADMTCQGCGQEEQGLQGLAEIVAGGGEKLRLGEVGAFGLLPGGVALRFQRLKAMYETHATTALMEDWGSRRRPVSILEQNRG